MRTFHRERYSDFAPSFKFSRHLLTDQVFQSPTETYTCIPSQNPLHAEKPCCGSQNQTFLHHASPCQPKEISTETAIWLLAQTVRKWLLKF